VAGVEGAPTGDWRAVYAAIDRQRRSEGASWTVIQRRANLSRPTLRAMQNGQPLVRPHKIADLLAGMGWAEGSIESILGGGPPIKLPGPEGIPGMDRALLAILEEVRALRPTIGAVSDQIEALGARVDNMQLQAGEILDRIAALEQRGDTLPLRDEPGSDAARPEPQSPPQAE
jgi:phage shock protein A